VGGGVEVEVMTDGRNQSYRTWEIKKKEDRDMKTLKAAMVEDTRVTILPENLNVRKL